MFLDNVVVELLGPKLPGIGLARGSAFVLEAIKLPVILLETWLAGEPDSSRITYALSLQLLLEQTPLTTGRGTRTRRGTGSAPSLPGQISKDRRCPTVGERVGACLAKPTPWARRHASQPGTGALRGGFDG